jgi:EAL domain-containing protein (putative c-di-GMP-specific phosphodiesterase class I)
MRGISSRNVRLAIDDFGTGYSSMSLVKDFPIDTIKMDRTFVRDLGASDQNRAFSAAIISLGKAAGLTVVAEGVETAEQDAILKEQNCHEFQGYLFSRPMPPSDVGKLLANPTILLKQVCGPPISPGIELTTGHWTAPGQCGFDASVWPMLPSRNRSSTN